MFSRGQQRTQSGVLSLSSLVIRRETVRGVDRGSFPQRKNQSGQMQLEVSENGGTPKWMVYFIMENPTKNG